MNDKKSLNYGAKDGYRSKDAVKNYEKQIFSGMLGKYRYSREHSAVKNMLSVVRKNSKLADIPCGNGGW